MAKWKSVDDPELLKKYHCRHVRVLLNNNREWYGWWGDSGDWRLFDSDADIEAIKKYPHNDNGKAHIVRDGVVIGWLPIDDELAPAIPAGWTPASEPPIDDHDVRVLTKNGDGRGWYCESIFPEEAGWRIYPSANIFNWKRVAPGEVLAWREIEPERDPRVRYCVAADLPTSITVWHDSYDAAEAEAKRLCVKRGKPFRVLKVVAEVKNGAARKTRKDKLMWLVIVESTDDVIDRFSTYEEAFAVACDFTRRYEQAIIREVKE